MWAGSNRRDGSVHRVLLSSSRCAGVAPLGAHTCIVCAHTRRVHTRMRGCVSVCVHKRVTKMHKRVTRETHARPTTKHAHARSLNCKTCTLTRTRTQTQPRTRTHAHVRAHTHTHSRTPTQSRLTLGVLKVLERTRSATVFFWRVTTTAATGWRTLMLLSYMPTAPCVGRLCACMHRHTDTMTQEDRHRKRERGRGRGRR